MNSKMFAWFALGALCMFYGVYGLTVVMIDSSPPIVSDSLPVHRGNYTGMTEVWISLIDRDPALEPGTGVSFVTYNDGVNDVNLDLVEGDAVTGVWQATLPTPLADGSYLGMFAYGDLADPANIGGLSVNFTVAPASTSGGSSSSGGGGSPPPSPPDDPPELDDDDLTVPPQRPFWERFKDDPVYTIMDWLGGLFDATDRQMGRTNNLVIARWWPYMAIFGGAGIVFVAYRLSKDEG